MAMYWLSVTTSRVRNTLIIGELHGTRQISKAVFTTPKEEELIKELITDGVTVEIRQVPSDSVIYAKDVL